MGCRPQIQWAGASDRTKWPELHYSKNCCRSHSRIQCCHGQTDRRDCFLSQLMKSLRTKRTRPLNRSLICQSPLSQLFSSCSFCPRNLFLRWFSRPFCRLLLSCRNGFEADLDHGSGLREPTAVFSGLLQKRKCLKMCTVLFYVNSMLKIHLVNVIL